MMSLVSVEEQYKKFPDLKKDEVNKILEWIQKQPHLPNITELEAMIFLYSNYCKIEATKTTIDNYYTCRTHVPHFFDNRDVLGDDIMSQYDIISVAVLPQCTKEGYKVIIGRLLDKDPTKFNLNAMLKMVTFILDVWLLGEGTADGHVLAVDLEGVSLGHVARLGIMSIKHYMYYLQEALPIRLKGLHFLNIPQFVDKIVILMKPFMKKELWEVFHLHSNYETFYKYVDPNILPGNYPGGEGATYEDIRDPYLTKLGEWRDYFLEEEKTQRVNEKARPGKPKDVGQIFGLEGNFRKLELD